VAEGCRGRGRPHSFSACFMLAFAALVLACKLLATSEFAHVDGWIVVFEYFLANNVFDDVFHRDDAGDGAKLIDCDAELLMFLEEDLQGIIDCRVVRDVNSFAGHRSNRSIVLVFRLSTEDIAAADDARDVFGFIAVGRDASKGKVAFFLKHGARCHDLVNEHFIEAECVVNHLTLIRCEGALLRAFLGE
jgi:hypothetical protein